ncbi:hypothetical protein DCAR_0623109 [Daucus carota subsp. sativus]|uniref:Uncharacterized protein n=1 Tax=Daucus carota subsp. sativus TaxID=79200 RepID=A0A164V2A9_DAUCS|nr:hypothetical protein DCAR_0623109 [Daucus carota subsp. sativus]
MINNKKYSTNLMTKNISRPTTLNTRRGRQLLRDKNLANAISIHSTMNHQKLEKLQHKFFPQAHRMQL